MSTPKELHFFNDLATYERGLDWYADHFDPTPETKAIGEATPSFQTTDIPEDRPDEHRDLIPQRTHDAIPDARLVLILRDPVERAVSAYYHFLRKGSWPGWPSMTEVSDSRGIVSAGFYDVHLAKWLETFDREQLLVFVYEEAFRDDASKRSMVDRTFEHIGVDPSFEPSMPEERLNSRMKLFELRTNQYPRLARGVIRRAVPRSVKERYEWGVGRVAARASCASAPVRTPRRSPLEHVGPQPALADRRRGRRRAGARRRQLIVPGSWSPADRRGDGGGRATDVGAGRLLTWRVPPCVRPSPCALVVHSSHSWGRSPRWPSRSARAARMPRRRRPTRPRLTRPGPT